MSGLALPAWVQHNVEREKQADEQLALAKYWNRLLKEIDPYLSLIWIKEGAEAHDLEPGRWHIKRSNPMTLDTYWPVVGDNGEYREPDSRMLDELTAGDLWNPRVHRDRKEAKRRLRAARVRARELKSEQRRYQMAEGVRAANRVPGEGGMTRRRWGAK